MDFGNAPKIVAPLPVSAAARSDSVAPPGAVGVELPPERTVQSAPAGEAARFDIARDNRSQQRMAAYRPLADEPEDPSEEASDEQEFLSKTVIEPTTGAVVVQKTDPATGRTVSQFPDEIMLKLKIYSHELLERANGSDRHDEPMVERSA